MTTATKNFETRTSEQLQEDIHSCWNRCQFFLRAGDLKNSRYYREEAKRLQAKLDKLYGK